MGIRGYSAAAVWLALMAGLLVSCQRLVGIHPSRDAAVGDQAPPDASDGATPAGAVDMRISDHRERRDRRIVNAGIGSS